MSKQELKQPVQRCTDNMVIACYNIPIVNQPMYHSCCDTLCNRKHRKKAIRLNRTWIIFTKHSCSSVNNDLSIFVGTYLQVISIIYVYLINFRIAIILLPATAFLAAMHHNLGLTTILPCSVNCKAKLSF